jgi:hypothetical protein
MDEQQREAFEQAVGRKKEQARQIAHHPRASARGSDVTLDPSGEARPGLETGDRTSHDTNSVREKRSGHGQKTADERNQ